MKPQETNGFERYRDDLRRFIGKTLASSDDMEDILQETYSRVYHRVEGAQTRVDNHRAYIFVTAANLIKDFLRSNLKRRKHEHVSTEEVELSCNRPGPEGEIVSEQLKQHMLAGLETLDPKIRQVFVMHRYQELTHTDIATKLGVNVRTVERRMKVAVDHFRYQLRDYL